ncbi:MAG TPA: hypothetical protein QF753_20340 [Victivallales bacterium]|nr:hypothetical protein [Victivallales bacterium]
MKKIEIIKNSKQEFYTAFEDVCIMNNYELLSANNELLLLLPFYSADGF